VLVVGVGSAALRSGHDSGNSSSPATTRITSATSSPTNVPPATVPPDSGAQGGPSTPDSTPATDGIDSTNPPGTSGDPAFDRAVAYLGALPATADPSCRLTAANPSLGAAGTLEEVGVDCTQTSPAGARVDVRHIVLKAGVAVQQYLDGLASVPGLQVSGGSLPSDPNGPYLDLTGRLQDGSSYSCRAWALPPVDDQTNAVAIACSGAMADVINVWRDDRG
jgi:hypothetical protein